LSAIGGRVNFFLAIKGDFLFLARKFYCFGKEGKKLECQAPPQRDLRLQLDRYFPNPKTIIMVRLKGLLKKSYFEAG
jgi:hypothetical protein